MRLAGIIRPLIRERHPFAVLAMLAMLIPGLLSAAGAAERFASFRLADGTTVICTGNGFVRLTGPVAPDGDRHDNLNCCTSGCIHAGGVGLTSAAAATDNLPPGYPPRMAFPSASADLPAMPDAPGAIRAPPAGTV